MPDYKYEMQLIAEETAEREFGKDFYSLTNAQQYDVFRDAEQNWVDHHMQKADLLNDIADESR